MNDATEPTFDTLLEAAVLKWRLDEIRAGRLQPTTRDLRILRSLCMFQRMQRAKTHREEGRAAAWETLLLASEHDADATRPGNDANRHGGGPTDKEETSES
ncbi:MULTISPECIES: hypothetical protein [unclassified Streptomyces]|uniref:hypothetical protein n=1 Tax=unclassified Streptomyces TaxID=2593676 RepID=UPI002E17F27F|nr:MULTISPECIES: hypothetical protein [unclassified Streptomyces]